MNGREKIEWEGIEKEGDNEERKGSKIIYFAWLMILELTPMMVWSPTTSIGSSKNTKVVFIYKSFRNYLKYIENYADVITWWSFFNISTSSLSAACLGWNKTQKIQYFN